MAGDWIKVEKATPGKPEVMAVADELGIHVAHAFGLCVQFWMWCDDQMTDGHARRVTNVTLDAHFGHAGFATALVNVGWLRVRQGSLEVPNFDRHLSESAKNRALSGRRQQKRRGNIVTEMSRSKRDECVTREEKRRVREERQYARAGGEPAAAESGGWQQAPAEAAETDEWRRHGWAHDEWARIVKVWNATERAVPWTPLTPPNGFADLAASPGWVESALTAIGLLPACQRFQRPVPWTQFVRDMDRILAGEFRDPPEPRRELAAAGGRPQRRGNMR